MSVENPDVEQNNEIFVKPMNGEINGISNGHSISSSDKHRSSSSHKSSSKDKHRDKDKSSSNKSSSSSSRDKDRDKSRHSSSSNRDKDKHSSSSSHKSSSSRDKDREKDKHRDKDKERDREKDKEREKNREKDKDRHKDKSHNSSSGKDDKEKNKDDKEKSKDSRSSTNSSSHKEKDKSSSSNRDKDKGREKDRDREKDKDREKDRHKSSSSKDKHSSSSKSSKDKERSHTSSSSSKDKDRNRDKEKRDKEKENDKSKEDQLIATKNLENLKKEEKENLNSVLKREEDTCFDYEGPIKMESEESKNNSIKPEFLNSSQASSCDYSMSQFKEDEAQFVIKEEAENEGVDREDETQTTENRIKIEKEEEEDDDEEEIPLAKRKKVISEDDDEDDELPLVARKKIKKEEKKSKPKRVISDDEDEEEVYEKKSQKKKAISEDEDEEYEEVKPKKKKLKKEKKGKDKTSIKKEIKREIKTEVKNEPVSPQKGGRKKKEEEQTEVWKWWEEEKREDGVKWNFLEHKGVLFAPPYEPLKSNVKFYYDGKEMKLSPEAEEVACFYAKMLEHEYTSKKVFNDNFFKDWRKFMTSKEKEKITNLFKCNFQDMCDHFKSVSEKNKNRTKAEKEAIKQENERIIKEYGFCTIDGHQEKVGNFRIEPPGLFRGRGEHPKMGMVKRRVVPEDVLINCSKDSKIPAPPSGHKWREVRHDNTVTWLASWVENVQGQVKYVMLNPSSKLKGEKDWQKYETARRLHKTIDKIRNTYQSEWKSKEMRIRQRAVALYFIDKLALRAGNEKDEDQADTVGCCSLRVEHISLHKELDGKENVVVFDFLGKDSIRYYNEVEVEKRVFKNLELFKENKKDGDDLFDRLNTTVLNEHLRELMDNLTAKVFRTYNASITLQRQLDELTDPNATDPEKLLAYNRANRAVAILCNHQRSVPKGHSKSMANLKEKIQAKREQVDDAEVEVKDAQKAAKRGSTKDKMIADKKSKILQRMKEQLKKLELQETDRDENKTIALGTSKLNYLDPRISVAWCKKYNVPIEKIFNKTQRDKFRWAIEMATEDYSFIV